MTDAAVLLQAIGVGKTYGRATALSDASLTIRQGSVTGIVGESGSGKTTLARVMAGLLRPDAGRVDFERARIDTLHGAGLRALRRHLQYVHQDPAAALDPRMRIRAILHEPLVIHTRLSKAGRDTKIRAILGAVGIPEAALDRYPHQLSGGQQRRIALARILILEPRLVILDEPTAGLDLLVQAALLTLLDTLKRRLGLTYLIVTHDIAVVDAFCDDVAVMHRGRIVERGPAGLVLAHPSHPYTQELLSALPRIGGPRLIDTIVLRDPAELDARTWPGCAFRLRCPLAIPQCGEAEPSLAQHGERWTACWTAGQQGRGQLLHNAVPSRLHEAP